MDLRSMIGWFGLLLAAACVMVLLVAGGGAITRSGPGQSGPDDLFLPITMLFLKPIGFATMAAGAVGLFWPANTDVRGHNTRCWGALAAGVVAAAISFVFGPTF